MGKKILNEKSLSGGSGILRRSTGRKAEESLIYRGKEAKVVIIGSFNSVYVHIYSLEPNVISTLTCRQMLTNGHIKEEVVEDTGNFCTMGIGWATTAGEQNLQVIHETMRPWKTSMSTKLNEVSRMFH